VDEEIAFHLMQNKKQLLEKTHDHIRANFAFMKQWMAKQNFLEWVEPDAGVVCFPRLKPGLNLDVERFYPSLYQDYSTIAGPGHWFERDKTYMRIGFGYPGFEELKQGLQNLEECLTAFAK
jgi:aspartate/methionine/tyrosine aminotransferase